MQPFHTEDYTDAEGRVFRIEHYYDDYAYAPWDNSDCHGPVTGWEKRDKCPGELILVEDRHGYKRFYDYQGAVKQAREQGWYAWNTLPTAQERGEALNRAVMADYKYLRGWCNGDWHYMGQGNRVKRSVFIHVVLNMQATT